MKKYLWQGAALLAALILVAPLRAQDARGAITGIVSDPTGAVVPNAPVDVTNKAMGTKVSLATNSAGLYSATFLIPGVYQVTIEFAGFKKFIRDGIEVRVNDRLQVDIQLQVGTSEQSITVTGDTPLLTTESASLGTVVDNRRVTELPIPHGNPYFLIGLAAGVSFTRDPRLDRPFEPTHIVGYTMDGTRANRSDITIDGAVATATANAGEVISSYVPPADIVAEFKVQTATFDASFGQTEGGVTNISLKSGTNALHGTMYYTNMTPGLFANDFFANANRIAKPDFFYHRWGASTGGPIRLPKIYDGRNKTFFMWGYEGILEARPRNNGNSTVPTTAMKGGDFSALPGSFVIYNPFTRRSAPNGRFQQDPFPGNRIPTALFNPISKKVLDQFFPAPLQTGNADGTNNYLRPELQEEADYYTHSVRVDHTVTDRNRLFARASWYDRVSNYNNYFNNLSTGEWFLFSSRAGTFDDVHTFNATTVLNVRYGYNRFIRGTDANPEQRGFDLTSLGFPASYANQIPDTIRRFPRFNVTGYQGTAIGGEYRPNDTHSLNATLQKTMGTHNWKTGTEFRSYRETDTFFGNNQTGQFDFDAGWTRGPLDNSPTAPGQLGQSVAAFLLGLPSGGVVVRAADYAEQSTSWGMFFHDDWKVNSKLTLNIGLRYEFETPLTERYNKSVRGFDRNLVQPVEAAARAAYAANPTPEVPVSQFNVRGGLTFAGINGQPRGLYNTPKNILLPRFGMAYKLGQKTVFRAGYGMFYGFLGQRRGDVIQSGFSRNTNLVPSLDNGLTFRETLSNPFRDGILEPVGAAQGSQTFLGQGVTSYFENPLAPQMQRWQAGFQREIGRGYVLDMTYVGNRGTHIEIGQNLNVTPQQYLSSSLTRDNTTINYLSANLPNPLRNLLPAGATGNFTGVNISRERLLRPFTAFDAVNQSRFDGYSWYHSGRIGIERRFSQGYTFSMNYTLSKYMQAVETFQADDARPLEIISDADRPHRLAASGIWELPFGKGRMFLNGIPRAANFIVGGWQLGGVYTFQSGAPINFGNLAFSGNFADIALPSSEQRVERWINTNAGFERTAALQLASNRRYFPLRFGHVRADNINNIDFSLIKNTVFKESLNLQIKGEFLNGFNHPLFPAPNTSPTVAAFGQVIASTQANYSRRVQLTAKFIF